MEKVNLNITCKITAPVKINPITTNLTKPFVDDKDSKNIVVSLTRGNKNDTVL